MVTRFFAALALALGLPCVAHAAVCSIPYTFVQGTFANANLVNGNFTAVITCLNALDTTNIGPAGFFASNFLPTSTATATFGGTAAYTFPAGLNVSPTLTVGNVTVQGATTAATMFAGAGSVPFNYLASGTAVATTFHGVLVQASGFTSTACGPFGTTFCVTVPIAVGARFTSGGSTSTAPSFTCGDGWTVDATDTYFVSGRVAITIGAPNSLFVTGSSTTDAVTATCWGI